MSPRSARTFGFDSSWARMVWHALQSCVMVCPSAPDFAYYKQQGGKAIYRDGSSIGIIALPGAVLWWRLTWTTRTYGC